MSVWSVLLAGGVGSRFWPVSRAARPKQLLDLFGEGPMLRVTLERARPLAPPERTLVVTSTALAPAIAAMLPEVPGEHILAEPVGRNTAPAIAWAALHALDHDPDAMLMVLPADHHIVDVEAFRATCARALALADTGRIVTLGIPPTHPETGYGYIRRGAPLGAEVGSAGEGAFAVAAFTEKPDVDTAADYLIMGGYDWNAGMFFVSARLLLAELAEHRPDLHAAMLAARDDLAAAYPSLPSVSIDYAVMERSQVIAVLPGHFGWSDVGSWRSLWDHRPAEASTFARGDVVELDGHRNVLFAEGGMVCAVGVSDLVVVHTPDVTFVCPREATQRAKDAVQALTARGRSELL
ncbi:MAG: mannose-1-phosphate guanylyltransferase [Myxococcota bacterium]